MSKILKRGDKGPEVKALQLLLANDPHSPNAANTKFYHGAIDGDFRGLTGQACVRAKFKLGYAARGCQPVAGALLIAYLTGKRAPTAVMRKAAARRRKDHPAQKAWADMVAHLGEHESPPGSNHCPDTVEWGHGDMSWCNVRVSLSYIHAGSTAFSKDRQRFQYVPAMLADAQAGRNGLVITHNPVRGDIVVWDYPGGGPADHTTEFGEWVEGRTLFRDIGGNEGANGIVKADVNHRTYVRAFIHVKAA